MGIQAPVYDDAFFEEMNGRVLMSAETVVPLVIKLLEPASVVDIGCGIGTWLSVFRARGVGEILGVDGSYINQAKLLIPAALFKPMDLTMPITLPHRFDLAVSLEVAEHLPARCAAQFIESLCQAAHAVLFSAAIPGQGGTHHVNEQWPEYWRRLFARRAFRMFDPFRPVLWYDETVAACYRQNLFLFVHEDLLRAQPALLGMPEVRDNESLMLISPKIAFDQMGLRAALKRLPRLVCDAMTRRVQHCCRDIRSCLP
jgi:SAM-dependent methyltransferase